MKKITLLLFAALSISLQSFAQCGIQPPCTNSVDLTGLCSTNQNYNGDHCFSNGYLNTSNNLNNWFNLTFSNVDVYLPLNMNGVCNIFSFEDNYYEYISMDGSDNIYVHGNTTIHHLLSNNSIGNQVNYITLINDATLYYNFQFWNVGDTIYLSGNNSNKVVILGCLNTSLPLTIEYFEKRGDYAVWKVNGEESIEVQYASHGDTSDFRIDKITYSKNDKIKMNIGFYRLKVGFKYSKILEKRFEDDPLSIPQTDFIGIYDIYGQKLSSEPYNQIYWKDGKKMPARFR